MTGTRKRHSAAFRARVALEAAKQTRTLAELSGTFQVHSVQISKWKKQLAQDRAWRCAPTDYLSGLLPPGLFSAHLTVPGRNGTRKSVSRV